MPPQPIDQAFGDLYLALKRSNAALADVNAGFDAALEALRAAWDARTDLGTEISGLRESVSELQRLILEQGAELKALRARLNGDTPS